MDDERIEDSRTDDGVARLADSVRRLIDATVTVSAPAEVLTAAAQRIDCLVDGLRPLIPDPPPPRYGGAADASNPGAIFPYDVVMGQLNPLAAPVRVAWEDPKAVGRVCFGKAYEGPPGCVHGAVIAAAFDQVFNVANLMRGNAGPTARLEVHFRRPTPLFKELRFEGWQERVEERKIYTAGQLLADNVVTVEAQGLFVLVSVDRVMRMLES